MYAISIKLDGCKLSSDTIKKYIEEIDSFLWDYGIYRSYGLLIAPDYLNAVDCVIATQKLNNTFEWFSDNISEINLLRIDEISDLMRAIQ